MKYKYLFYIGDAAKLIGVSTDTIRRWANNDTIATDRDQINSWRIFSLSEINRIRGLKRLPELSLKEAKNILGYS
jgi:DNA-binding transcriptional MerR regulator